MKKWWIFGADFFHGLAPIFSRFTMSRYREVSQLHCCLSRYSGPLRGWGGRDQRGKKEKGRARKAVRSREEKSIHHHRGDPPFFLFLGLRLYGVYPSFRTYGVYPFPLFSQANGIHHSFFCSVTSGSGDRPRKEGCHGGGVYSFFPGISKTFNSSQIP